MWSLSFGIPQFKLLSHKSSLQLPSGNSGPVLTLSNAARSSPFCPHLLVVDVGVWSTLLLGVAIRHVICGFYLFFLPVRLPSEIRKLPPEPPVGGFPGVWKLPLLRLPSRDGSPSPALLSLFLSFIFCPTSFQRQWAAFLGAWCPQLAIRSCFVKFAQRSVVLLMNLWGESGLPVPFLCRLGSPWHHPCGRKWRRTKEPLGESERREWKVGLKLNIQKTKIMAASPITSW